MDLPSLKFFFFENVKMVGPQQFLKLVSRCPILEDLTANWVEYDEVKDYAGWIGNLSKLVRVELRGMGRGIYDHSRFSQV